MFDLWENIQELGRGGYGFVFLGRHKITRKLRAIKMVSTSIYSKADEVELVYKEATSLMTLRHRGIIKLKQVFRVKQSIVLVM